jgi:hypothetical protein
MQFTHKNMCKLTKIGASSLLCHIFHKKIRFLKLSKISKIIIFELIKVKNDINNKLNMQNMFYRECLATRYDERASRFPIR